jgi:glycosyltransferase involved in cell wall biosynthesis
MRSLIVTDSRIWTAEAEYARSVAAAEAQLGWDVTLAAPAGSAVAEASSANVRVVELPGSDPGRSPADFLADVRFLSAHAGDGDYGVVHSSRSAPHLAAALAVGGRAPLVHLRSGAAMPRAHAANRYLYRRRTASVVASSERIRKWVVERLGVPRDRVHRILAPVSIESGAPAPSVATVREEFGVDGDAPLIVNVARLAPIKGQHVLVGAMASVVREVPEAVVILVGEPWSGEPEGLMGRARELGIERSLIVTGRRLDVSRFLAEATVCVSSSVGSEENSRAVGEYMAAGRPVVGSRVGVIPELVEHGVSGLLVCPGSVAELAAAIVRLLSDAGLRDRLAGEARAFALRELSPDAFARGIAGAIESAGVTP